MTKCFQSNVPAKMDLFSEREAVTLGPALQKVLGATNHKTVRGEVGLFEVIQPRIPEDLKASEQ